MKIIMFDMDGVVADFAQGFTTLGRKMIGDHVPIVTAHNYACWGFSDYLTPMEQSALWKIVKDSHDFWLNLKPLVGPDVFSRVNRLSWDGHQVYFVTSRPGHSSTSVQRQTWIWLKQYGIHQPNVIVSNKKGDIAAAIKATHSIEDKIENAWCVHWISPKTKSYLINRPYNQLPDTPKIGSFSVKRIDTVEMFLDEVEK